MMTWRCKCGYLSSYGTMPPWRCTACPKCGSDLATSPEAHEDPRPHEFSDTVRQENRDGTVTEFSVCRWCSRTEWEIQRDLKRRESST